MNGPKLSTSLLTITHRQCSYLRRIYAKGKYSFVNANAFPLVNIAHGYFYSYMQEVFLHFHLGIRARMRGWTFLSMGRIGSGNGVINI